MSIIAIIPARGGSERVPGKNLVSLAGAPLIAHSIRQAIASRLVSQVYVSTDDNEIAAVSRQEGAQIVNRPLNLASSTATSESAVLHVLDSRREAGLADPDLVVFLQCTSPVRAENDIDAAIERVISTGADSLFSACSNKNFIWSERDGKLQSVTYDFHKRQREQDLPPQYCENGSIYVFRPGILRANNNRLGGRIAVYVMDFWSSFQIDEPDDVTLIEWILNRERVRSAVFPRPVKLVVFDFDGVMTDNAVYVDSEGREFVRCSRSDGLGLDALRASAIPAIVLSTEANPVVAARCKKVQLPCFQGVSDKALFLKHYMAEQNIDAKQVVYVGNDLNDLGCFEVVGCAVAVADAYPAVKSRAHIVLSKRGGDGAVRELCDLVCAS